MEQEAPHPESRAAIAARMKLTREALGLTQVAFAAKCGLSQQQVHNYENNISKPSTDEALKMDNRAGIRIEWIYSGVRTRLPQDVLDSIVAYEARMKAQAKAKKAS